VRPLSGRSCPAVRPAIFSFYPIDCLPRSDTSDALRAAAASSLCATSPRTCLGAFPARAEIDAGEEPSQRAFGDVPAAVFTDAFPMRLVQQDVGAADLAVIERGIEHPSISLD
jgi:hypothetical protein